MEAIKQESRMGVVGVIVKNNKLLLGKRQKTVKYMPNAWHLPGGFVEKGEELFEALIREFKEEANIKINPIQIISSRFDSDRNINITYIKATVDNVQALEAGSDLKEAKFVEFDKIETYCKEEVINNWPFDYKTYFNNEEKILSDFLVPTEFCDYKEEGIQLIANYLKAKHKNQPRKLACALYYFVRDTILYEVGNWNFKASETLAKKSGSCSNSANLFVALSRACGIPAAFGVLNVKGQEYLGPISPTHLAGTLSKSSKHIYALIYLEGKWIKCDPSDDIFLSLNTQQFSPQCKIVEFDGYNDATLNLDPKHIINDKFPLNNIDAILKKKMRKSLKDIVAIGNHLIAFFRNNGYTFTTAEEGQKAFSKWLRRNKPYLFLLYETHFFVNKYANRKK